MQDAMPLPPWDPTDLAALLTLDTQGPLRFQSRFGDANLNGRSFGGQVLGQALMAAAMTVSPERSATVMQFLFLQGSLPHLPVDFEVSVLQDGGRFSSRHVRGMQPGGRVVLDAHATFAVALRSPSHADASSATEADPERLPRLSDVPPEWAAGLRRMGGYSIDEKPCIDFRLPDLEHQLDPARTDSHLRFWLKCRQALPERTGMHAAAFAYLSDWWLNFTSLGMHVRDLQADERLYISSLNHTVWFHRPLAADDWLYFDSHSPSASDGRGLSIAQVHDRQGRLVATATQECVMGFAG